MGDHDPRHGGESWTAAAERLLRGGDLAGALECLVERAKIADQSIVDLERQAEADQERRMGDDL